MAPPASPDSPVRLRNKALEITILPKVGAKIWEIIHLPSRNQYLWHNPRIRPVFYPIEANFDNYWCGGWDDGFPTCEACQHNGEQYPNLGELRSVQWDIESLRTDDAEPEVVLSAFGPISPVKARKTVRISGDSVEMEFQIEHIGALPFDFIWGTHPAYRVGPGWLIHIPATTGIVGQSNHPKFGSPRERYRWPNLETTEGMTNMSVTLGFDSGMNAGHYATGLRSGWYALEDPFSGTGMLVEFPLETCPYLWLWLSYGGWRGYQLAVIEPWTSCPVTLSEAVAEGTHRTLKPGEMFACRARATPWARPATLEELLSLRGLTR
jgi:hypothetical protein